MTEPRERDWEGKRPADFIGRRTRAPYVGVVVGGYVDACAVMLFEIETDTGRVHGNVPRTVV